MNKDHLDDILVDLEVLYGRLPPLAKAHINEAQRYIQHAMNPYGSGISAEKYLEIAAKQVSFARGVLG